MEPTSIQLFRLGDGRYSWEVCFEDAGLDQDGFVTSYAVAMSCILGAVDNAALPPEGAVE